MDPEDPKSTLLNFLERKKVGPLQFRYWQV